MLSFRPTPSSVSALDCPFQHAAQRACAPNTCPLPLCETKRCACGGTQAPMLPATDRARCRTDALSSCHPDPERGGPAHVAAPTTAPAHAAPGPLLGPGPARPVAWPRRRPPVALPSPRPMPRQGFRLPFQCPRPRPLRCAALPIPGRQPQRLPMMAPNLPLQSAREHHMPLSRQHHELPPDARGPVPPTRVRASSSDRNAHGRRALASVRDIAA
jgi:hypothetical protein